MCDFDAQLLLDGPLDFKQSRVAKLHHGLGLQVDEMVVLAEFVGAFILRTVVPKLVLDDQTAIQHQLDGVIQGGTTDAVLVVFHLVIERVDVEVPVGRVNLFQDGEPFRGLAQLLPLEIVNE